jgi:hypothetical protein
MNVNAAPFVPKSQAFVPQQVQPFQTHLTDHYAGQWQPVVMYVPVTLYQPVPMMTNTLDATYNHFDPYGGYNAFATNGTYGTFSSYPMTMPFHMQSGPLQVPQQSLEILQQWPTGSENQQNTPQQEDVPHGLSLDQLQRSDVLEYISQQKEWTPLESDLFAIAKRETEERDLSFFYHNEDQRRTYNHYICQARNLLHPLPDKEITIDVSVLERCVNGSDYCGNDHYELNELLFTE